MRNENAYASILMVWAIAISTVNQTPGPSTAPVAVNRSAVNSEARSLLAQAKTAALQIRDNYPRGLVLDQLGAAEARNGDLEAAADTATRAYPHNMATLTALGEALGNTNDLSKAKSLSAQLEGGSSSTMFYAIAQRQALNGSIDQALQTIDLIQAPEVRSEALKAIAEQQSLSGDQAGARRTLALAGAPYPDERSRQDDVDMMVMAAQLSRGDKLEAWNTIAAMKSEEARFSAIIGAVEQLLQQTDRTTAAAWIEKGLRQLPAGPDYDFWRYLAIPTQVKLGMKPAAMQAAGNLPGDLRAKGFMAIAVVCAETRDIGGVDAALAKMRARANSKSRNDGLSDFRLKLNTLNITAALIDNGQFEAATRLLATVDRDLTDASSRMGIQPQVQLQRVVMFSHQNAFDNARLLAMKMRPNSTETYRGTALRTIAILDTKKNGIASSKSWALSLADSEDRAYALLGIAQTRLELDEIKLPYSAIQIH